MSVGRHPGTNVCLGWVYCKASGPNLVKRKLNADKNSPKTLDENPFEKYFAGIYGERWASLKQALLDDISKETLHNPFGPPFQDYSLDAASLLPPKWMQVARGESVADFCASPGGKSLAMIFSVGGEADFACNDLSPARAARLKAVFHDCLPPAVLARVKVSVGDAGRWGLNRKNKYDRILVDAPCSGERHLLNSPQELARWSLKGAKRLVIRQNALLCSALDCLKSGGRLVYSTCSINPIENDGVIERLGKSRESQFQILKIEEQMGEATAHGWIALPDKAKAGPIYFSVLQKN